MAKTSPYTPKDERTLMTAIWAPEVADDPLAFVMFVFPWGKKGTPLEKRTGPRKWQRERLEELRDHIKANAGRIELGLLPGMLRDATVSGRGVGKSALVAWLILWMMSTRLGGTVIVTANTEHQLKSKTWAELGKWHTLALNSHWFERSALALRPSEWFEEAVKRDLKIDTGYYYAQAQLWSEENPDAFAGAHNELGMMVIYDEASGIPAPIWTVTEGFFTEPEPWRFWFVFSNGRRNTGAFFECFHKHRNLWRCHHIDGRTVEGTDPAVYQNYIDTYGADSDEARVEVYGQFPRHGERQFISRELIEDAQHREIQHDASAPLVMGVDVARFGSDKSVIRWRQGRDGRTIPARKYKGLDNMQLAYEVADWIGKTNPDEVCIDAGNGTGAVIRAGSSTLRRLQTGSVRAYAMAIFTGVVAMLGYYLWRQ